MINIKVTNLKGLSSYIKKTKRLTGKSAKQMMSNSFIRTMQKEYRFHAQEIIARDVYAAYQPKEYQRTFNLLNSVTMARTSPSQFSIYIPLKTELKAKKPDDHQYYPRYVIAGVSLWNVPNYPARDFYYSSDGWLNYFKGRFTVDFQNRVLRKEASK